MNQGNLKQYLSQLLLLVSVDHFESTEEGDELSSIINPIKLILAGESSSLLKSTEYSNLMFSEQATTILSKYPDEPLLFVINEFLDEVAKNFQYCFGNELGSTHLQLVAIALLQTFIQANFTGPSVDMESRQFLFSNCNEKMLQVDAIKSLTIEGQQAYDLTIDPLYLVLSLTIFEKLMGIPHNHSLLNWNPEISLDVLTEETGKIVGGDIQQNPLKASLQWWRARALQVHLSILSEPSNILSTICSILLNPTLPNSISPETDNTYQIQKHIRLIYYLECARSGIQSQTEHLSIPYLIKARKVSELQLILSGAKAKRTKHQTFSTSNLIILAKSAKNTSIYSMESFDDKPQNFELESEILLERPQFESLENLTFDDEQGNIKRIKFDTVNNLEDEPEKLLPIAIKEDLIPPELRALDPNNQPILTDLDSIQLLLRLTTIKQTSPSQNPIVDEELMAIVSRIIYASSDENKRTNWSVFSRALWERSLLETNKSKTIERGILQMTSLVEETAIKIKSKIIPEEEKSSPVSSRLRFIHQIPLMPQWTMNIKLAEKYMSLGVIRSAIEIYERLQLFSDAALCYAAVGEEKTAEKILIERIKTNPDDARAISILGDIKQDPNLWLKAWEIGRYSKAKVSLSKYYYSPPKGSGLAKNLDLSIKHMFDALTVSPLIFDNWYFYGCCGLETGQFELASEAFTRCVTLDDTSSHSWSNLATSLIKLDKLKPAFNALKKAIRSGQEKRSWKIFENYLIVAMKLNEWNDVLYATREIIDIRRDEGEVVIDIDVIEKLVQILLGNEYDENSRQSNFQSSCIDLICNVVPELVTTSHRLWRIVAKVELWRKRPWAALECYEKAFRVLLQSSELGYSETIWNEAVEACSDLIAAYESLGELPGKHNAQDVVCKDWKYKSKTSIRSLMSKGKSMWEDSPGWIKLLEMKSELN